MEKTLKLFKTPDGEAQYTAVYNRALSLWPVPYEEIDVPTRLGSTHAIASGSPAKPALLLLHGAGNSATMWFPVIAKLNEHYRTYALDTIGDGGKSRMTRMPQGRAEYAGWLEDVLDGLNLEQAFVTGLSMGGWLSLNLALCAQERVKKLVLLAPAASLQPFSFSVNFFLRFGHLLPTMSGESAVRWLTDKNTRVNPDYVAVLDAVNRYPNLYMLFPDVYSDAELRSIRVPTLIIYGDQEVIYSTRKAAARAQTLMPDVKVEFFEHANHFLPMDQPARVADAIVAFLGTEN